MTTQTITGNAIVKALTDAKAHLKYPSIHLTVDGQPLVFKLAGARSKYAGSVNITDGGPFGSNVWYGSIKPDGTVYQGFAWTPSVTKIVAAMEHDLQVVVSSYGKVTGRCAFCHLPLSDERSTAVGYGPICAQHYSLPWG